MKSRKTFDVTHTGKGGPVRVPLQRFRNIQEYYPSDSVCSLIQEVADTIARREYGKNGLCRICNLDSWSINGRTATYQCFIGYPDGHGGYTGKNIWVYWSEP